MGLRTSKIKGVIRKAEINAGSKSEHDSYLIEVGDQIFQARMKGLDAFGDDTLLKFLDKEVQVEGVQMRKLFIVSSIQKA